MLIEGDNIMNPQDIKNLSSSYSTAHTEIPDRLRDNKDLRYIRIKKKEKKPFEDFWTHNTLEKAIADWDERKAAWEKNGKKGRLPKRPSRVTNYSAADPILGQHLARGGNYGIAAGYGGLAPFDSDEEDRLQELGVFEKLPPTFRVRTGSGGFHRYYYIPDLNGKIVLYDKTLKDPKKPEEALHLGEIQWIGTQVVGPGSTHPNGKKYEVVDDLPIATITMAQLLDAISCCKFSKNDRTPAPRAAKKKKSKSSKPRASSAIGDSIPIQDIAMPDNPMERNGKNGREIFGSHPMHGSTTGKNFHINVDKNTWYCHRCSSGGGPLEWLAVKSGLITCEEAGPGCLRGEPFRRVLDVARELGYKIPARSQSLGQIDLIENRIIVDKLPEDLPTEPIIVIKGPPRIGKTYWAAKQLVKAREGNYITHRHSIVQHAIEAFRNEGGQYAVWLEGKHRRGMCRKERPNCSNCEFCPHDKHSFMELKETASKLLSQHKILTKDLVPYDLCPYYILKLAEESANYCFTVVNFIEDIQQRSLTVFDEDPTLAHFYPPSAELFRFKKARNEYKIDNSLGKAFDRASPIRTAISEKDRPREEDTALLWAIDTLGGINESINITMSSKSDPEQCYEQMANELASRECNFSLDIKEKALRKLDDYHIPDPNSENDIKKLIAAILDTYQKKPLHLISSGGSGYSSVYLIGDASTPVIDMGWTDTAKAPGHKILIIGNTLAELFGKSLGDAVVLEIQEFKYRKNYVVVAIDSGDEDAYRGDVKNQRLKIRKIMKAVADDPDSKTRRPIMALVGSKEHQERLMRSLGGIAHASQEEGEMGQQWNHRGGYVNIFYQNSVVSRGLDVPQYNVICVHDTDFIQPYWAAARDAGDENAGAMLNSIMMDETTNSVLRISPIMAGNELQPKIVIITRADLWKVRYLDEQVVGGQQGGRTPDISCIAKVIAENNLTGTAQLVNGGISIDSTLSRPGWEEAVKGGKLAEFFKIELDRVKAKSKFADEEIADAKNRILEVLKKAASGKGLSIQDMKDRGLKCKNELLRPALRMLHYQGKIKIISGKRKIKWAIA